MTEQRTSTISYPASLASFSARARRRSQREGAFSLFFGFFAMLPSPLANLDRLLLLDGPRSTGMPTQEPAGLALRVQAHPLGTCRPLRIKIPFPAWLDHAHLAGAPDMLPHLVALASDLHDLIPFHFPEELLVSLI